MININFEEIICDFKKAIIKGFAWVKKVLTLSLLKNI